MPTTAARAATIKAKCFTGVTLAGMLRVSAALLAAAVTSATLVIAADLIGLLFLPGDSGSGSLALAHIVLLWPLAFALALVHATALGLPAFLLVKRRGLTHWWVSLLGGFAIGALPYSVLWLTWTPPSPDASIFDPKFKSWLEYAAWIAGIGLVGMAGGFAAWLTWRPTTRRRGATAP